MKYILLLAGLSSVWGTAFRQNGTALLQQFKLMDQNGKANFLASIRASFPEKLLKSMQGPKKMLKGEEFGSFASLSDAFLGRYHNSPHQVSLQYYENGWQHFCSGAILNSCNILTTVTCLILWDMISPYKVMYMVAGAYDLSKNEETQQKSYMENFSLHPSFSWETWDYDFAIINPSICFEFNDNVNSVKLPPSGDVPSGSCTISGWNWGMENKNELKNMSATIISRKECQKYLNGFPVPKTMFCATSDKADNTLFDFGGTVRCPGDFTGIVSFPESEAQEDFTPWLVSEVSAARPWIDRTSGSANEN